jgi:quercetin dioxygenase-like cupin family protein
MYQYPHTIQNKAGEKLTFLRLINKPDGDRLEVEGFVKPGCGPPTHVHWKQEESVTVISGRMATQVPGQEPKYYGPGETVTFYRGTWHRFWNAGEGELHMKGWVKPANNVEYFLTELYKAIDAGKDNRPEPVAAAFLIRRYRSEFGVYDIPAFVQKVIMPVQFFIGKLSGAHNRFKEAPESIK